MFIRKVIVAVISCLTLILIFSHSNLQFFKGDETQVKDISEVSAVTSTCKYYGYWDHLFSEDNGKDLLEFVNYGQSQGAYTAREIIAQGIKAVPSISHSLLADETVEQWRAKLRGHNQILDDYDPKDVLNILLMDEPFAKGFTTEQLELMIAEAKSIIGDQYKFALTFTRGSIQREKLPQNLDVYVLNFYPFFEQQYAPNNFIRSEHEFKSELRKLLNQARRKTPDNSEFFIIGQGFQQPGKWAIPPLQSPYWYAEVVQNEDDIIGLGWFELRGRSRWIGSMHLPELFAKQKEAFRIVCPN